MQYPINVIAKRCLLAMLAVYTGTMTAYSYAAAFQLWEQDAASMGNYHAGYAALANDASTAFYNPAGIVRIKNQQIVFGGLAVITDFKYTGTLAINSFPPGAPQPVTAQGGVFAFIPFLHYVTPLTDTMGFGFSVDVPFGLKTNYGNDTIMRYAATETSVMVVDISPSLGFQITDKASLGIGIDIQKIYAEIDQVGGLIIPDVYDTSGTNRATGTGYGYHLGGLYQFTPDTRAGISYHSQVVHHLSGSSRFEGPLAELVDSGTFTSRANARVTLPPYTAFSIYHKLHRQFAVMGSAIYTQWNTIKGLTLNDISGIQNYVESKTIQISLPTYFHNTWNFSVGADYYANDRITLRGGIGYDETPVTNTFRDVRLPDNNRYIIAIGGHYQATKAIGIDLGWLHLFANQAHINPPPLASGDQVVTTDGHANGGADVYGVQFIWDIA